jgi:hypothetical protein
LVRDKNKGLPFAKTFGDLIGKEKTTRKDGFFKTI